MVSCQYLLRNVGPSWVPLHLWWIIGSLRFVCPLCRYPQLLFVQDYLVFYALPSGLRVVGKVWHPSFPAPKPALRLRVSAEEYGVLNFHLRKLVRILNLCLSKKLLDLFLF